MRPTRHSEAIDEIEDVFGECWLVREYRATEHGFDLALGWPAVAGRQGASVIITAALAEYLQSVERPRDIRLPIGGTVIKRLRARLGIAFDWDAWWRVREADLRRMTLAAFAERHHCSTGAASQRRVRIK